MPCPTPAGLKEYPVMNQQQRMLPALVSGSSSGLAPPPGTMSPLWAGVPGMPRPPPHAQPPLMLSQEQHRKLEKHGLHLLPITLPGLAAQN